MVEKLKTRTELRRTEESDFIEKTTTALDAITDFKKVFLLREIFAEVKGEDTLSEVEMLNYLETLVAHGILISAINQSGQICYADSGLQDAFESSEYTSSYVSEAQKAVITSIEQYFETPDPKLTVAQTLSDICDTMTSTYKIKDIDNHILGSGNLLKAFGPNGYLRKFFLLNFKLATQSGMPKFKYIGKVKTAELLRPQEPIPGDIRSESGLVNFNYSAISAENPESAAEEVANYALNYIKPFTIQEIVPEFFPRLKMEDILSILDNLEQNNILTSYTDSRGFKYYINSKRAENLEHLKKIEVDQIRSVELMTQETVSSIRDYLTGSDCNPLLKEPQTFTRICQTLARSKKIIGLNGGIITGVSSINTLFKSRDPEKTPPLGQWFNENFIERASTDRFKKFIFVDFASSTKTKEGHSD